MKSICGLTALGIVLAISQSASADGTQSFCDKNSGKFTIKLSSCSVDSNTGNTPVTPANGRGVGQGGGGPTGVPGGNKPGGGGGSGSGPTPG